MSRPAASCAPPPRCCSRCSTTSGISAASPTRRPATTNSCCAAARPRPERSAAQLDFAFDLDRDIERQLGETDRAARMRTALRAEDLDDEFGEAIDDERLTIAIRRGVDHPEDARPRADTIQIAQRALQ